jgi:DNA replication protein DnaC
VSNEVKSVASLLSIVPFGSDWTDEQWAEHDAEVERKRLESDKGAAKRAHEAKRSDAMSAGFPRRAIEAADACDETAAAIVRVRDWRHVDENVLVLSGSPGCGKTVAATWWALRHAWMPVFLRSTAFAASSRFDTEKRDEWLKAQALVLDDLGTEYADTKGNFLTDLDELIDTYYGNKKPLLITTNCTAEEFKKRYGARIVDRLRECGTWYSVAASSMRRRA